MSKMNRWALIGLSSLISAVAIVLFWEIWGLVSGSVPTSVQILLIPPLSRWWDIVNGPVWSSIFIVGLTMKNGQENLIGYFTKGWLMCASILAGFCGLIFGLEAGIYAYVISSIVWWLGFVFHILAFRSRLSF